MVPKWKAPSCEVHCRWENGPLYDLPTDPSFEDQSVNPSNYHLAFYLGL